MEGGTREGVGAGFEVNLGAGTVGVFGLSERACRDTVFVALNMHLAVFSDGEL